MDIDNDVDFDDLTGWKLATINETAYEAMYGFPVISRGDFDGDFDHDFDDTKGFVGALSGSSQATPEPQTIVLALIAAFLFSTKLFQNLKG